MEVSSKQQQQVQSRQQQQQQRQPGDTLPAAASAVVPVTGGALGAVGSASAAAAFQPSSLAVGQQLRIVTVLGEVVEGELLAFDPITYCLLLQDIGSSSRISSNAAASRRNVCFLQGRAVRSLAVTGMAAEAALLQPPQFDAKALQAKEEAAVRKAVADAERIGVGVTAEAQDLFDALSKTLPVSWDRSTIVVLEEVRVPSPYVPENVTGGSVEARERVKKVLMRERERLRGRPNS